MKLTTLIITICILQVSASTKAQITLKENKASLQKILEKIGKQSGYDFIYSKQDFKDAEKISINLNNVSVEKALEVCFSNQPLTYEISDRTVMVKLKKDKSILDRVIDYFVNIDVKGRVVDNDGNGLAGASIKVKGNEQKTTTNSNGEFILSNIDENAILMISYIGYESKEVKAGKVLGNILLVLSTSKLEEVSVVSTGYQQIAKERSAGSFQQISNAQFNNQVGTQVLQRLEAIGSSLKVDRSIGENQLNIRGISSIGGPRDVLIVLDNFPYDGDLSNINPNDVDQITILKDAAATSIWGARAGNGVIVITTKTARYKQALKINVNANATVGLAPDLMYLPQMETKDFIALEQLLFKADRYKADYNSPSRPALSPVVALLYDDKLTEAQKDKVLAELAMRDVRRDFNTYFYQNSLDQQYSLSLSAGSERFKWSSAVGYDTNKSNLAAGYNRLSIKFASEYKLLDNLTLQTSITYTDALTQSGKPEFREITSSKGVIYPYTQLADGAGSSLPIVKDYNYSYIGSAGNGKLLDWKYYPLTDYLQHTSRANSKDMLVNAGIQYNIKGFSLILKYQLEQQDGGVEVTQGLESYAARNLINSYSQIQPDGTVSYPIPKGAIRDQSTLAMISHNIRGQLGYQYQQGNHQFDLMGGGELRAINKDGLQFRYYGYNPALATQTNVDYLGLYPNFITGAKSFIPSSNGLSATANRFVSLYGNASYSYLKKYIVYLSARRDASNIFGVHTNDKWKPLWSAAMAWIISDEGFFNKEKLSYLKARLSYGTSGNIDPSKTAVTTIRYASVSPYTQSPYAVVDRFYNPELKWETVTMMNLGLDFVALNKRVSGSIEYFHKQAKDLFGAYPIDYTSGVGSFIVKNVGAMKGNGLDIELNVENLKGKFNWKTNLNLSTYKDKVTAYYLPSERASDLVSGVIPAFSGRVGMPVYSMYSYRWTGLEPETGDPQGMINGVKTKDYASLVGADTKITDLVYHGSAIPVWFGNIGNQFAFGKATLGIQLTYKFGHYFRTPSINYTELIASGTGHSDYGKRWQMSGDEMRTNVPSFRYPNISNRDVFYLGSEVLVQRADHIRLQYINFNYELIQSQKSYIKRLDIYANIANLGVLWRANTVKIDPEYNGLNKLLPPKTISLGTKITF